MPFSAIDSRTAQKNAVSKLEVRAARVRAVLAISERVGSDVKDSAGRKVG